MEELPLSDRERNRVRASEEEAEEEGRQIMEIVPMLLGTLVVITVGMFIMLFGM